MHHLVGELNPFNLPRVISPWYNHPKSLRLEHTLYTIEHKTGLCKRTAILGMSQNQCTTKEGLEIETNGFWVPLMLKHSTTGPYEGSLHYQTKTTSLVFTGPNPHLHCPDLLDCDFANEQRCSFGTSHAVTHQGTYLPSLWFMISFMPFQTWCVEYSQKGVALIHTYTTIDTRWTCRVGHVRLPDGE